MARRKAPVKADDLLDQLLAGGDAAASLNSGELVNRVTPLQAVIRYRDLLHDESLFGAAKASFDTRPIFHQSDADIRGHVFCSFLALTLAKELMRLCEAKGIKPEWQPLLNDLDRLQQATIEKDGKAITVRTPTAGMVGSVFQVAGVAIPANIREQAA